MTEAWYDEPDLRARLPVLIYGLRRIHAHSDTDRRTRLRWYFWESIGWARYTWEIRRRHYPLTRAYRRLLRALGVREAVPGDSRLRYVLTEPWEYPPSYWWGRLKCRFGCHNGTCRGQRYCPPPWGCGHPR